VVVVFLVEGEGELPTVIVDSTETNLIALRRTIYLTIQSSLDFEECAHKLIKMQLKPGQEVQLPFSALVSLLILVKKLVHIYTHTQVSLKPFPVSE
jgi:hypothetical protein